MMPLPFFVTDESLLGREVYEAEPSLQISPFAKWNWTNHPLTDINDIFLQFDIMLHRPLILRGGPTGFYTLNLSIMYDEIEKIERDL